VRPPNLDAVGATPTPSPANLEHRHLRSALQFAVEVAHARQRQRPPLPYPAELKPHLKQPRIPTSALGKVRRAIGADAEFRAAVAAAAAPGIVDEIGLEWLRRDDGWADRVAALVDEAVMARTEGDLELAVKRAEKRREAAEDKARQLSAELAATKASMAERDEVLRAYEARARDADLAGDDLREQLRAARQAERDADQRQEAAKAKLAEAEAARDRALAAMEAAEEQRDELLASRAEAAGVAIAANQLPELRRLAEAARDVANQLDTLVRTGPERRTAIAVPGALARDPRGAAEHLLRTRGVLVLVDGYNVAMLAWPDAELEAQREHLLDAVDAMAQRYAAEVVVVFDGAAVIGSHTKRRRLARVRYSPEGVSADDVIRLEVAAADVSRPIVVVTNDQEIRRDVSIEGANTIASEIFAELALS